MYITHRRFRGKALSGKEVNIPAMTKLDGEDGLILYNNEPLCFDTSQVAHKYITRNDDGNGMERGMLTYEIAFSNRKRFSNDKTRRQRFTDEEIELLSTKWQKYLNPDVDVILFNQAFFDGNIGELREMAKDLHMKGVK